MDAEFAFGKVLRKLRLEAGLSQENLAFDADLDRSYVGTLEHGHHQPSLRTLLKLAQALNISTTRLMELVEQEMARRLG